MEKVQSNGMLVTECNTSTIKCDVDITQREDGTIKYEKT